MLYSKPGQISAFSVFCLLACYLKTGLASWGMSSQKIRIRKDLFLVEKREHQGSISPKAASSQTATLGKFQAKGTCTLMKGLGSQQSPSFS